MSANVVWQEATVGRERRWEALGQQGATVWFTGLPGAGKTTIATAVEARLIDAGRSAYRLDGDNLRHGLCRDLGFSKDDRETNVGRVGEMARLFADAGTIALVALVSPYTDCREKVRELHHRDGLRVPRGVREHTLGGVRAPRPEGAVRARTQRQPERDDGRGRPLRGAARARGRTDARDGRRRGDRRGAGGARRAPYLTNLSLLSSLHTAWHRL